MGYEVVTKDLPDSPVFGIRFKTTLESIGEDIGKGYAAIFVYIAKLGAAPAGPPMALYYHMDMTAGDIDMELCVPVEREAAGEGDVKGHVLPGGRAVSTFYKGPYDGVEPAYDALFAYMKDNNLSPAGPSREIYLTDPSQVENPADNLTEVLFPVK